ncbi:MAG: plasmid mobilization protein [Candidatus Nezhaarchaeales archaeon]
MRDEIITVRLTKEERETIDSIAREFGMTRSNFIRFIIRNALSNIHKLKELVIIERAR